jgi:putative N6-adenine-specific DNA methylase
MKFIAKTLFGLENVLADELKELGAADIEPVNRAVLFSGSLDMLYRVNYWSRCALAVLVSVDKFRINSKDDLYSKVFRNDWSIIMDPDMTFSVVPVVNSTLFGHTGYAGLIVKDAIADHFRKRFGRRPSVDTENPDVMVNLHISNDNVDISIDSSVVPLFKRGYRKEQGIAPLNEVLAAGIVRLSGWDMSSPLIDPMCGSGTIPVEAGLMAFNIPPGRFRTSYGFMKWKNYNGDLFLKIRNESIEKEPLLNVNISASDISEQALIQAAENFRSAGLEDKITVKRSDFRDLHAETEGGWLITNPPYGQRLQPAEIDALYSDLGGTMKHKFPGFSAWLITSDKEHLKNIGLRPSAKIKLYNGSIECILAGYDLYSGTRKHKAQ